MSAASELQDRILILRRENETAKVKYERLVEKVLDFKKVLDEEDVVINIRKGKFKVVHDLFSEVENG